MLNQKKQPPKKKKISHSKQEKKKLDTQIHKVMREIALLKHPYCVVCGRADGILQGGHLIPKAMSRSVRYSLMNVHTQCSGCNSLHRYNQAPYINWFIKEFGAEEFDKLVKESKQIKQYKISDLRKILEDYKKLLNELKMEYVEKTLNKLIS